MSGISIRPWCVLLLLLMGFAASSLSAAVMYPPGTDANHPPPEKPTMVGTVFDVVITDDKGGKQKDRFLFDDTKLACAFLTKAQLGKIPYEAKPGKEIADPIPWTATFSDTAGNKVSFTGEAVKDAISGTITVAPKGGDARIYRFTGGKTGTETGRKALATLNAQ